MAHFLQILVPISEIGENALFHRTHKPSLLTLPFLAIALLVACGGDPAQPPAPGVEPEVVNSPDVV